MPDRIPEKLFIIAKQSMLRQLKTHKEKTFKDIEYTNDERGIFVRLLKNKTEKGCMGFVRGVSDFEQAVEAAAVDAAFFDPRYRHITSEELKDIIVEITIIGPLEPVKNYKDFVPGRHSIYLVHRFGKAFMQAQIAKERGWGREDFLKAVCRKAGIDENSYKQTGVKIFRAETVFEKRKLEDIAFFGNGVNTEK